MEVKPCPFCGRNAGIRRSYFPNGFTVIAVHKTSCYFYKSTRPVFATMKLAENAWNRRVNDGE